MLGKIVGCCALIDDTLTIDPPSRPRICFTASRRHRKLPREQTACLLSHSATETFLVTALPRLGALFTTTIIPPTVSAAVTTPACTAALYIPSKQTPRVTA